MIFNGSVIGPPNEPVAGQKPSGIWKKQDISIAQQKGTWTSLGDVVSLTSNVSPVNETNNTIFTISLTTADYPDGTTFPYTVTGIDAADLAVGNTSGNFTITNGVGTVEFEIAEDNLTEGEEVFTITAGGLSLNVTVEDTSVLTEIMDPFAENTVLLLDGNGADGGNNNVFLDSSTNNFTITRNGNTTQGTFSPFSAPDGRWGNFFDGTTQSGLQIPNDTSLNLAGSAFTIECWVYLTDDYTDYGTIIQKRGTTTSYQLFIDITSGNLSYFDGTIYESTGVVPRNQWSHCALTHNGTTLKMFLNGTQVFSQNIAVTERDWPIRIGGGGGATENFGGYISNLRILKGTAIDFSSTGVPTGPLTAVTNTVLLTCQSNRFVDTNTQITAKTISLIGSPKVTPFSPFAPSAAYSASVNGGSGYFDGTTDHLLVAASTGSWADFGTDDFTIEAWIYTPAVSAVQGICGAHTGAQNNTWQFRLNGSALELFGANGQTCAATTAVAANQWVFVTASRSGANAYLGVNGTVNTVAITAGAGGLYSATSGGNVSIGNLYSTPSNYWFTGYVSSLRIRRGTAAYTSSFTPPTASPTAVSGTELLLNFTNSNILDQTGKNVLETVGNASANTTTYKYGTGSMYFDGTGDYLLPSSSTDLVFGTGDFTIEAWIYPTVVSSTNGIVIYSNRIDGSGDTTFGLLWSNSRGLYLHTYQNIILDSGVPPTINTWQHVAYVRHNGILKIFLNGTQIGSASFTANLSSSNSFKVGAERGHSTSNAEDYEGYLDDFRITKGIARYTQSFIPPQRELPWYGGTRPVSPDVIDLGGVDYNAFPYTVLSLDGDGTTGAQNNTFLDSSNNTFTITRNGNTTQGTFSPFSADDGKWSNYFSNSELLTPSDANNALGTSAFTIEAWINLESTSAEGILAQRGGTTNRWIFWVESNKLNFKRDNTNFYSTSTIPTNEWVHVAFVREGTGTNESKLYINGKLDATGTIDTNFTQTNSLVIGDGRNDSGANLNGYISNVRLTKSAVYTSNFTPSTTPLTAIENTYLLTCQSNRFVDNSTNAFALTSVGTPSVQSFSPFAPSAAYSPSVNGGSGYFDGTGDYLQVSDATLALGTGDFSIQFWVYNIAFDGSSGINSLIDYRNGSDPVISPVIFTTNGQLFFRTNGSNVISGSTLNLNEWYFIGISRASGTTKMFVNGVQVGSDYSDTNNYTNSVIRIGADYDGTLNQELNGYMSGLKITQGAAVDFSALGVPTTPPTADANTELLCNFTNAGILDATGKNNLETVGDAQINTTTKKYGTGSMAFIKDTTYISGVPQVKFSLAENFTIEGWAYLTSDSLTNNNYMTLFELAFASKKIQAFKFRSGVNNNLYFRYDDGSPTDVIATYSTHWNVDTWFHFAYVKNGTIATVYVNGNSIGTDTISGATDILSLIGVGGPPGGDNTDPTTPQWYIDDLRITKGVARYRYNFTPPAQSHPDL